MSVAQTPSDGASLARLLTWLSPAFPVGAFAYSQGLETVIAAGQIAAPNALGAWIESGLAHGGTRSDAVLAACAHRAGRSAEALAEIAALSLALAVARERHDELRELGQAFIQAASAWHPTGLDHLPDPCPYPVAVGAIAAAHGIGRREMLIAFLAAQVQSQISVGLRLIPLGQTEGLRLQAKLEPRILALADWANGASLSDLGAIAHGADIAMMAHESLSSRIFKS